MKIRLISLFLVSLGGFLMLANAEGSALSAAEQAALDALNEEQKAKNISYFTNICNNTLLHAPEDVKEELIASLNGKTCAEAALDQVTVSAESANQ